MKWINFPEMPPMGKEVIFDGDEQPPIWGSIVYNGKFPSILCHDINGESESINIGLYERWLDESEDQETAALRAENEALKKLLRMTDCPELLIQNPTALTVRPATQEEIERVKPIWEKYLTENNL